MIIRFLTSPRLCFDPNVQVIRVSEPADTDDGVIDRKYEGQVLEELLKPTYNDTHKLFSQDSKTAPPPANFLSSLQQLMGQRAAKSDTPSQEDVDDSEQYVKDESGHWVSKSQLASRQRLQELNRDLMQKDTCDQ